MSNCLSVCLTACLSICLSTSLTICLYSYAYICVTLATPTWPQEVLSGSVRGQPLCVGLGRLHYLSLSWKRLNLSTPCILHNSSYFVPHRLGCKLLWISKLAHRIVSVVNRRLLVRENFPKFLKFLCVQSHSQMSVEGVSVKLLPNPIFNLVPRDTWTVLSFGFFYKMFGRIRQTWVFHVVFLKISVIQVFRKCSSSPSQAQ